MWTKNVVISFEGTVVRLRSWYGMFGEGGEEEEVVGDDDDGWLVGVASELFYPHTHTHTFAPLFAARRYSKYTGVHLVGWILLPFLARCTSRIACYLWSFLFYFFLSLRMSFVYEFQVSFSCSRFGCLVDQGRKYPFFMLLHDFLPPSTWFPLRPILRTYVVIHSLAADPAPLDVCFLCPRSDIKIINTPFPSLLPTEFLES